MKLYRYRYIVPWTAVLIGLSAMSCTAAGAEPAESVGMPEDVLTDETNGLPGDVNGDGVLTTADVIQLRHYLDGDHETAIDEQAADVNADFYVTEEDLTMISQYLVDGGEYDPDGYAVTLLQRKEFEYMFLPDDTVAIIGYLGHATEISVPEYIEERAVTAVGTGAFSGEKYANVTAIEFPAEVRFEAKSVDGLTGLQDENGFLIFNNILCEYFGTSENVAIPTTVTRINDSAFANNESIRSLSIPASVGEIGRNAFEGCSELAVISAAD